MKDNIEEGQEGEERKKSENVNARSTEQGEVELDLMYLNPLRFLMHHLIFIRHAAFKDFFKVKNSKDNSFSP